MELRICVLVLNCLMACQGLKFKMNRDNSGQGTARSICGVLICEENTNVSVTSVSSTDQTILDVDLNTIESMSVFKKDSVVSDTGNGQTDFLLGSLTSQAPSLTWVANGRKLDGSLQPDRASLRIELVKQADCESEFSCQVRGKDSQGREVVSTASLVQQPTLQRADQMYHGSLTSAVSLQVLASIQQMAQSMNGLENRLKDKVAALEDKLDNKIESLEDKLDNKIESLEDKLENKVESLENRIEDKLFTFQNSIRELQKECTSASNDFEHRLQDRLDLLEKRIENEIHNNQLNKSLQLEIKYPTGLKTDCEGAKDDRSSSLNSIQQRLSDVQSETLKNISERFENTLSNATVQLTSIVENLESYKSCDQTARNDTRDILKKLTSGEISVQCVSYETIDEHKLYQQPLRCARDMGKTLNQSYPQYITMTQFSLNRDILCDTETDGGGWTVILRRTKGDVYFNRDWESYKNGFGKIQPDGDFWLGNEAVHILTSFRSYELRVELTSDGKEYVQVYKTFKLESEANKYTLRLGTGTGPIDDGKHGISYSNNLAFSTFDSDNDSNRGNCALEYKLGWWFKSCTWSTMTAPRRGQQAYQAWHTGQKWLYVTRAEMKIRPLK